MKGGNFNTWTKKDGKLVDKLKELSNSSHECKFKELMVLLGSSV